MGSKMGEFSCRMRFCMQRRTVFLLSIAFFLGLLGWGFWTFLYYLGVPVHMGILVPEGMRSIADGFCSAENHFCRGIYAFFPFLWHTMVREMVFFWYGIICLLLFLLAVGWSVVRSRSFEMEWTLAPWKLLLLFVGMVWLLFTCMLFSQEGTVPFRTIIEPRPDVYREAGEEAIASLQKNYTALKERGCLTRVGTFGNVAEASQIKIRCLQQAFFTRILPPMIFLVLFLFELLIAGRLVLHRVLRIRPKQKLVECMLCFGTGIGVWIILLWLGAALHIYTPHFGWALALLVPILGFRHAQYWIESFTKSSWSVRGKPYSPLFLLGWFLLSYFAFNYINVVRPFPIGWDDLGSYLNRPRLLVSYGAFVHSMASFQWEYLTSYGFLLFGYESTFGATNALMINWSEGLLATLAVYLFGRIFLGPGRGLLSATVYYTLPLVGHFSFADMKIDNAVFLMGALATFCVFYALLKREDDTALPPVRWILLAGIFAGLAFAFKVTAIMVFVALACVLAGLVLHWTGFLAAVLLVCAVFTRKGLINIPKIAEKVQWGWENASPFVVMMIFAVLGLIFLGCAIYYARDRVKHGVLLACVFVFGFSSMVFPWIMHNDYLHGTFLQLRLKAPNNLTPIVDKFGTNETKGIKKYTLPPELAVSRADPHCEASAGKEELDRYWGNHTGWGHYITLPWRSVMNLDHAGYYVTTQSALLLFPLLLLLPYFWRKDGKWLRYMWAGTLFLVAQWSFFANGVPWYGIGMFLGLALCTEALVCKAPDRLSRIFAGFFVTMAIFSCIGMRLWQYDLQRNLFEYPLGKISAETLRERTIPYYDDITDIVLQRYKDMPERPLLYRIGTFMPYFVPRNLEVIGVTDHQLDFFNCLHQDRDNVKTLQRLKVLGINAIVFDTNTATIEKDPNGSLHKKVQALADFLNSPETPIQMIVNDTEAGIAFILLP